LAGRRARCFAAEAQAVVARPPMADKFCFRLRHSRSAAPLLPFARNERLRWDRRSGRAPGVPTDDRLTLASISDCGSADVVVRHDRRSSEALATRVPAETAAFIGTRNYAGTLRPPVPGSVRIRCGNEPPQRRHHRKAPESPARRERLGSLRARLASALQPRGGSAARGHREGRPLSATSSSTNDSASSCAPASSAARAAQAPAASGVARPSAARRPANRTLLTGEGQAAVAALKLHRAPGRRADDRRSDRIEVLSADVVEPIVVGAQEGADGRRDRIGAIAERLVREHGGELHHAHTGLGRGVPTAREPDRLVGGSGQAGVLPHPGPRVERSRRCSPLAASQASGGRTAARSGARTVAGGYPGTGPETPPRPDQRGSPRQA
jgi:hypothetical protein